MTKESIIYMAKEWGQDPTSCDFVFKELARDKTVLWVNSIGTRLPKALSLRDWRRIIRKLRMCFGGLRQVGPSAWLYQPPFIPLPHSRWAETLNQWLLRNLIRKQSRRLNMSAPQLWFFQPNGAFLVGQLEESASVYYCVDEWAQFAHLDRQRIAQLERRLVESVDVCFAASEPLVESRRKFNANTFLALHGVDHEFFSSALAPTTSVPADVSDLPHPIIGFFGAIKDHVDQPLLQDMARHHRDWSIVLIGEVFTDVSGLQSEPNIILLGSRPYEELPKYCKAFDVAIIPYVQSEFIRNVNPIKLRQYLSAGLPVVSTFMTEVQRYEAIVYVCRSREEFTPNVERALREKTVQASIKKSELMRAESWSVRVREVQRQVLRTKEERSRAGAERSRQLCTGR